MLSHSVFFSLHDNSPAAVDRLVAACKTYLNGHPGTFFFAAGTLAEEFQRPVNDRAFDVALHVIFTDRAVARCLPAGPAAPEVHRRRQGELETGPRVRRVGRGEMTYLDAVLGASARHPLADLGQAVSPLRTPNLLSIAFFTFSRSTPRTSLARSASVAGSAWM